jgi:DNA-binding transcriptional regulator LsrR (DeoR family)
MIVTGKSSDEMARFANQANKAAKALGANTKQYTDASLIYYQQGLNEKDVAARSNVTTKVANITG